MALIDSIKAVVVAIGYPSTPTEIAEAMERARSTIATTLGNSDWPTASRGAYYPPDRTPALLTDEELRVIKAMRAGQHIEPLTPHELGVVQAVRSGGA